MGMFDNVNVSANNINLPLPKGGYYQTKWLDSNLCEIQMDADGRMTCPNFSGCEMYPVDEVETLHHGGYTTDEFYFHGDDIDGNWHEFKAEVKQSRITKLWSYDDLLFDEHAAINEEFDNLPIEWGDDQVISGHRITSLTLVRHRRLKGGRRIIQAYRIVSCSAAIIPDSDGLFKVEIDNPRIKATLYGTLKDGAICMQESIVYELRKPYLRKGFKKIVGYNLQANRSNV